MSREKKPLLLGLILGLHSSYQAPWLHLVFLGSLLGDPQLSAWFVTRLVFGSLAPWLHLWFLGWPLGSHSSSSVPRLHWDCVCNTRHLCSVGTAFLALSALLHCFPLFHLHCHLPPRTASLCLACTAASLLQVLPLNLFLPFFLPSLAPVSLHLNPSSR